MTNKKRVFSGIRATGRLHLGNYYGAVKGMLSLQNDPNFELTVYMVVDVHTTTTPYDINQLSTKKRDIIIDYLAAGLNPEKSIITYQSLVPEHIELAFYFSTVATVARMQHLPTFKEKVKQHPQHVTMALINYPILMAADILAYKADTVPAGLDQEPHIEITREIARKMNQTYNTDFPEPVRITAKGDHIPSLKGEGKMSKSVEGSFINLTDDLDLIKRKLSKVPTDSGRAGGEIPQSGGVQSLYVLYKLFAPDKFDEDFRKPYKEGKMRYEAIKNNLAELIYKELKPFQEKRKELESKPEYVDNVIKDGAKKARAIASQTVKEVRQKMGLL